MRCAELGSASEPRAKITTRFSLLRQAGPDGAKVEKELRRLLPPKTKAEYEPDDVAPSVATKAVDRAQRCVVVARSVAAGTR